MLIEYNGVRLVMTDLIGYEREGVYSSDGADLLYTKHTLNCVCYLAPTGYPQATSIELSGANLRDNSRLTATSDDLRGSGAIVRSVRGLDPRPYEFFDRQTYGPANSGTGVAGVARGSIANSAFITDAEVRMRLMMPRKKLRITAWRVAGSAEGVADEGLVDFEEIVWLESPRPVMAAPDAHAVRVKTPKKATAAGVPVAGERPTAVSQTLQSSPGTATATAIGAAVGAVQSTTLQSVPPAAATTLETGGSDRTGTVGGQLDSGGTNASNITPAYAVQTFVPVYPPCDAANGPIPIRADVVEAAGSGASMTLNFQISTCLVPVDPRAERLVLSHRWQIQHGQDENHYLTRTITGELIFNGGLYRQLEVIPSDFLNQLLHPIPLGFKRSVPNIAQSSDGLVIQYTLVDTDTSITFDAGNSGCTNINIVESLQYIQPSSWLGQRV